jgi:hypothetical protein
MAGRNRATTQLSFRLRKAQRLDHFGWHEFAPKLTLSGCGQLSKLTLPGSLNSIHTI